MIPKILHQTYKTAGTLPPIYKQCQTIAKHHHADWNYRFWTDEDMYREVETNWPEFWPVFKTLPRKIMQIDMFRYCLMYTYGGLYADLDYYFLKPFDLLDEHCVIPMSRETRLGNCIFASEPGHPIWLEMIRDFLNRPRDPAMFKNDAMVCDGELGSGPVFVTRIVRDSPHSSSILKPTRQLFHAPFPNKKNGEQFQEGCQQLKDAGSYGFHICAGAWRNGAL